MSFLDAVVACKVCGYVVSEYAAGGWTHGRPALDDDHTPIPVSLDKVTVIARCDFCNDEGAIPDMFTLPATTFMLFPGYLSQDWWCVCPICAPLVERNEWNKLVDRAVAASTNGELARPMLAHGYKALRKHITGPIRPVHPEEIP